MIMKDGHEVNPLRVKRIYHGDRLLYFRKSPMVTEFLADLDLAAFMIDLSPAPVETDIPSAFAVDGNLAAEDSAPSEFNKNVVLSVDGDLYVKNVAPMPQLPPMSVAINAQAASPPAASGDTVIRHLDLVASGEAHSPAAVAVGKQESALLFAVDFEAAEADASPIETDEATAAADMKAAFWVGGTVATGDIALVDIDPVALAAFAAHGQMNSVDATDLQHSLCGLTFMVDAELWVTPLQWINPVLLNHVLGITQVAEAVQEGNILKLY